MRSNSRFIVNTIFPISSSESPVLSLCSRLLGDNWSTCFITSEMGLMALPAKNQPDITTINTKRRKRAINMFLRSLAFSAEY